MEVEVEQEVDIVKWLGDSGINPEELDVQGLLRLEPREIGLQAKEIPIELCLKKVTACREKLRVFEQRVNKSTSPAKRAEIQAEITRLYVAFDRLCAFLTL